MVMDQEWSRLAVVVWEIRQRRPLSLLALTSQLLDHQLFCVQSCPAGFRLTPCHQGHHTRSLVTVPSPFNTECQWTRFPLWRRLFVTLCRNRWTKIRQEFNRKYKTESRFMSIIVVVSLVSSQVSFLERGVYIQQRNARHNVLGRQKLPDRGSINKKLHIAVLQSPVFPLSGSIDSSDEVKKIIE